MPDMRAAMQFVGAGERLEARFVAATLQIWAQTRLQLLDAITNEQPVQPIVQSAGAAIAAAGARLEPAAVQLVERYLGQQLQAIDVSVPLAGDLVDSAAFAPLRSGLPAWQAAVVGRFLSDIGQLAGDAPAAIAAALTSLTATPQRAFLWSRTALQLASESAVWQSLNGGLQRGYRRAGERAQRRFQKQAIAAIDKRTTLCCLGVHGQIVDLDQPFRLSAPPNFGPEQHSAPFHHRCRTVIALYAAAMEQVGPTTEDLLAQARAEINRR